MANQTTLTLDLFDVYGNRLKDKVDISLRHTVLMSVSYQLKSRDASKQISLKGIDFTQGGRYELFISTLKHNTVHQFVQVSQDKETKLTLMFPVRPSKVIGINAPPYNALADNLKGVLQNSEIEGFAGIHGADIYHALDDVRKAGLLNIYAKMRDTTFKNPEPRNVFSYVLALTRLRGDRFFAKVQKELRDEVKNSQASNLFHPVFGGLHTPPPGYVLVDSYKTIEKYGNLQLTFFNNPQSLEFITDVDIDDAQGIEHFFQVIDHAVTGNQTNPYDVHEILLGYQKIDPNYTLVL
jgi:hypothetical protein